MTPAEESKNLIMEKLFRIWNGQEMIYDVVVGKFGVFYVNPGLKGDGLNENDNASLTPYNTKYPKNIQVMPFVGLTDKNGKPAFVGNIYKEVRLDGSERYYRIFEVPGGFAINTHQDDFYRPDEMVYFWSGLSDMQTASFFQNSLVEIGNVFDNPELLAKKPN